MKYTAIGLIVIAVALMAFAGISHLILTPPAGDAPDTPPGAPIFSPIYALVVAAISGGAGALLLAFGGRGFTKKTSPSARPSPN